MKIYFFITALCLLSLSNTAQVRFISSGKIEFERKINVHRQLEGDDDDAFFKEFISKQPRFHTTYFDLYFNSNKTYYKPGRETEDNKRQLWFIGPSKDNRVVRDFTASNSKSLKTIFEETFLVQDSLPAFEWKLSDEIRTIAGFDCRKAVTRICDSVYVVAFYTEEILSNSGPESFYGLPGMILGIAIPRLYTTWYATKLELIEPGPAELDFNSKGKKVSSPELQATLQKSLKNWGKNGQRNIWWGML